MLMIGRKEFVMKKIKKPFITLCIVIAMTCSCVSGQAFASNELQQSSMTSVADENGIEKYGEEFILNQTEACLSYEKLMDSFEETEDSEIQYPDYYAGSYINDNGNLVVYKVQSDSLEAGTNEEYGTAQIDETLEENIGNDDFILKDARYSYNELTETMNILNDYKLAENNQVANNFNVYWLSDKSNCIFVELNDCSTDAINDFKNEVCDSETIIFKASSGEAEKETKIKAGRKIICNNSYGSVGYRVKRNGHIGFITAGHMGEKDDDVYIGSTKIGKIKARKESGSVDAAFVRVTNDDYTPSNILKGTSNKLSTTISEPGVGTVINKLGATTGATTGKILSKNVTVTLDGITHTNLTSADYESAPGDSGGTVYSYIGSTETRLTLGIHCAAIGSTRYFVKANQINEKLETSRY